MTIKPETKKTINAFLMTGMCSLFVVLISMISITNSNTARLNDNVQILTVKLAERIVISDNAIKQNDKDHVQITAIFLNHSMRLENIEKEMEVVKIKICR